MTDTLRPAVSTDAAALATLAEQTFRATFAADNSPDDLDLFCRTHYAPAIQAQEIADARREIWVTEKSGELIAYFMLTEGPRENGVKGERPLELQRIYVDSRFHGQGIAQSLMEKILERARQRGFTSLWLGVWEHNRRALAYYAKHGFKQVGEHTFMLGNDPQRDLILELSL